MWTGDHIFRIDSIGGDVVITRREDPGGHSVDSTYRVRGEYLPAAILAQPGIPPNQVGGNAFFLSRGGYNDTEGAITQMTGQMSGLAQTCHVLTLGQRWTRVPLDPLDIDAGLVCELAHCCTSP